MRDLTQAQHKRRSAILDRIRFKGPQIAAALVVHLKRDKRIYITEDTVGKDLRDMKAVDTLWRKRGTLGRWVYGLCPGRREHQNE